VACVAKQANHRSVGSHVRNAIGECSSSPKLNGLVQNVLFFEQVEYVLEPLITANEI
jgi:hypothetical protein